jgi:cholesterol oxidase
MFIPESTEDSFNLLCELNGPEYYRRKIYPGFGHLDCYFGMGAAETIWPDLVAALDPGVATRLSNEGDPSSVAAIV